MDSDPYHWPALSECGDVTAREAGRPVTGIERYKAIAVRAGHPAIWAEGLAGPMGRSTHRDTRRC